MKGSDSSPPRLRHWRIPNPELPAQDIEHFLRRLGGPSRLEIPGRDSSRCRVIVTLLHGNETSGLKALHRLLNMPLQPAVTTYVYVIGIEEALTPPLFTHRQLPGRRDYNRCFSPPFDQDAEGLLCKALLDDIQALQPEAVVDVHNTSGKGPAFCVSVDLQPRHRALVPLFSWRLMVTDLKLGSLMETDSEAMPVITVECGGTAEPSSDQFAFETLQRFLNQPNLFEAGSSKHSLDVYRNPLRVELPRTGRVAYAEAPHPEADLTLRADIEANNFRTVTPDMPLGWMSQSTVWKPHAWREGNDHFDELYRIDTGKLYPRVAQKLFMITTNPLIALSDCLWYTVRVDAEPGPQ